MARKFKQKSPGVFMGHVACPLKSKGTKELCGSSDAGSLYQHDDESYSMSCFSCGGGIPDCDGTAMKIVPNSGKARVLDMDIEREKMVEMKECLAAMPNRDRKLKEDVYEMYGVLMDLNDKGDRIETIYYPTYRGGNHVGYRNRRRFKSWHDEVKKNPEKLDVLKCFNGGVGDTKRGIQMFGEWLWPAGGKRVIITCGEEDAMVAYHMISLCTKFDGGYPTVSTPSGENVANIKPNLPYLSSFEEIYIIADQDKQGRKFEEELCKILPVGKVRLVRLPKGCKDPSQMWTNATSTAGRQAVAKVLYNALWNAERYSPAGVMSLSEGWSQYAERGKDVLIPFPDSFGDLNHKTCGGYALGEIVNIIAPSSVGKSSFVKEMIYTALETTNYNIGVIALEETIDEFIEGFLSIHMSTQLNEISYDERDRPKELEAFQELLKLRPKQHRTLEEDGSERIQFLDHQGACSGEELLEKIDFLVNGLDCKIIVLDPVTLAVSGSDTDEDEMASEIVRRTKRKKLAWINVHHVRKNGNGGTANSEGGDLAEEDIKGTGAWFQTGMINLIFTRNKVHEHNIVRNTTRIKMSKCRRHGKNTGIAGYIYYNGDNGRLEQGTDPAEFLEAEANGMSEDKPLNSFGKDKDEWG